jgi:trimethylamine-N-oxide reductase cytochrome c-type subunit TorC
MGVTGKFLPAMAALALFVSATAYGLHATSSMEFCGALCHEMGAQAEELRYSPHAKDVKGGLIACDQCHIPAGPGPRYLAVKIYSGLKDIYAHLTEAPEKLARGHLQPVARRFVLDGNCLACHADLYKDAKGEKPVSELGRLAHDAYLGKGGQAKSKCAGCHINMAHLPEFDRRLTVNQAFAARLAQGELPQ